MYVYVILIFFTNLNRFTPLHVAAHFGQIQMVRFLLENDAKVESVTKDNYTPLHQAAQQGHTLIINLLLKHKANPNAITSVSTLYIYGQARKNAKALSLIT